MKAKVVGVGRLGQGKRLESVRKQENTAEHESGTFWENSFSVKKKQKNVFQRR